MATPEEVNEIVIHQLRALYKPQKDPVEYPEDYARLVGLYVESMRDYPPAVLSAGMEICRQEWSFLGWPVPGKLRLWMSEAQRDLGEANPAPRIPLYKHKRPTGPMVDPMCMTRWREIFLNGEIAYMTKEEGLHYCHTGERPENYKWPPEGHQRRFGHRPG